MNPSDYRRDYAAFRTAFERARFEHHAGLAARLELRPLEERYADLWTREAFAELRRAHDETPAQFETERAGLRALSGAAASGYLEASAREVSEELRRCEESAAFDWEGARLSSSEAARRLADERDAARRRELSRRRLDALRPCEDLRAARLEALGDAARALGFESRATLYESFAGASSSGASSSSAGAKLESLSSGAQTFLARTEDAYMSRLGEWARRELPTGATPEYADLSFFERAAGTEASLPAREFRAMYEAALAGVGVRVGSLRSLHVDEAARPGKAAETACFAVAPPSDVRLVVGSDAGGLGFQRRSFQEGGRAQMFAWASRESSARYPEFVHAPDRAAEFGHGLLLSSLFREPAWLAARRGMRAAEAEETARLSALLDLSAARRDCASLAYALALDAAADVRTESLAEEYSATFGGATGFSHTSASRLLDADEWFASATRLRARLFAASLGEHLRARHGRRWFEARRAGEELIDIWNTASRYCAEELARLAWGGELSFELLADASLASLEGAGGV
ncbi:MAG TPA: hypothetical protein VJ866_01540 [Pyrinomonadaceae bacterium]|nr:hypothetical protein [Pyrinomonadaceae bacterium]